MKTVIFNQKNTNAMKSLFFSFFVHVLFLSVVVLSVTIKPPSFKPQLAFLGSVVVDQNIFGNISGIERKRKTEASKVSWLIKTIPSTQEDNFKINKPLSQTHAPSQTKAPYKTTFAIEDITKDSRQDIKDNFDEGGYRYQPLKFEKVR